MLCSLNTRKSNGPVGISARMIKSCADSISLPNNKMIFNRSIRSGQLPCAWKESNVTPRSTGSATPSGQYHSGLSILSKERHTYRIRYWHILLHIYITHSLVEISKRKMYYHCTNTHHGSLVIREMKKTCSFFDLQKAFDQCHFTLCYISCIHYRDQQFSTEINLPLYST